MSPTTKAPNTASVIVDGPVRVRGRLSISGKPTDAPDGVALCRCGHSGNKPFCDGSHKAAGFSDAGSVADPGDPLAESGGPLAVTIAPNGPILLRGNLSIVDGTGETAWKGAKTALCRCGQSANKPFCDGTHTRAGFTAE